MMENNLLHPSKRIWVEMVFGEGLSPEQKEERLMKVWCRLKTEGRPIIGISHRHTEAMERVHPSLIDFLVVGCRRLEEDVDSGRIEVLMQYWGDVEEYPDLTTGDVMFTFLSRDGEVHDVNYATLRPRGLINPTSTW